MKAKSIFVSLVILLLLHPTGATVPSDWTTGVLEGDLITMKTIIQGTPYSYEIMSGGSPVQTTVEKDDKTEILVTDITADTIWYVRKTFDNAGTLKVESDPIPIYRNKTDIYVNFLFPNTNQVSNGRFFTPVITTNVDELSTSYTGHEEYELILTADIIAFEFMTPTDIFSNHRVEYDSDTGIFRYLEWRFATGVLASQSIREDVISEYVAGKCVACNTEVTTTPDPDTSTDETPLFLPIYGLFLVAFILVSRRILLKSKK